MDTDTVAFRVYSARATHMEVDLFRLGSKEDEAARIALTKVGARWSIDYWQSHHEAFGFLKQPITQEEELWRIEMTMSSPLAGGMVRSEDPTESNLQAMYGLCGDLIKGT